LFKRTEKYEQWNNVFAERVMAHVSGIYELLGWHLREHEKF
jgi:hypothetical protein